jgi:hypothetical protein
LFTSWDNFEQAIQSRFGPNLYDDPMEALTRLRQTSSISIYKTQFEKLSNRLKGLSENYKLSCFLSGLMDDIRLPLRLLKPQSLNDAFGLAKIQEEFVMSSRRSYRSSDFHTTFAFQQGGNYSQGSQHQKPVYTGATKTELGGQGELGFPIGGSKQNLQVQNISSSQIKDKRRKCLCYYCDDKYCPTH